MFMALFLPAFFFGCAGRHTPDTVHTLKETERENRIEELLREYRNRIDEFKTRSDAASASVRQEMKKALENLKKTHQEASERLEELRSATNTAWGDVNDELQASLDRLKQSLNLMREALPQAPTP
jgi:ArsR family metal-binding transcriptional regulator